MTIRFEYYNIQVGFYIDFEVNTTQPKELRYWLQSNPCVRNIRIGKG